MTLVVGQRMVRTDDGMKGVIEMVTIPGFEHQEPRIVFVDRGEKRIAGKREVWEPEKTPSRKLREEEIMRVAEGADNLLRWIDKNETPKWWEFGVGPGMKEPHHDPELVSLIIGHLVKRG